MQFPEKDIVNPSMKYDAYSMARLSFRDDFSNQLIEFGLCSLQFRE